MIPSVSILQFQLKIVLVMNVFSNKLTFPRVTWDTLRRNIKKHLVPCRIWLSSKFIYRTPNDASTKSRWINAKNSALRAIVDKYDSHAGPRVS